MKSNVDGPSNKKVPMSSREIVESVIEQSKGELIETWESAAKRLLTTLQTGTGRENAIRRA